MMRSLYMLSWAQPGVRNIRQRAAQVMEDIARSDPSEQLRQIAKVYAAGLGGRR